MTMMLMMFMKKPIMKTAGNVTMVIKVLMRKMRPVTVMMIAAVMAVSVFSCDVDYINANDDDVMMMMAVADECFCPTMAGNVSSFHKSRQ